MPFIKIVDTPDGFAVKRHFTAMSVNFGTDYKIMALPKHPSETTIGINLIDR